MPQNLLCLLNVLECAPRIHFQTAVRRESHRRLPWNLLPDPPLIRAAQLNIQSATVVSSRVTQDSDLLQENQSGNKCVTMGDTNRVL